MADQINEPLYKQLSDDMRQGLKDIYQQISQASQEDNAPSKEAKALFLEATSQLSEVLKATEEATINILEIVERNELHQQESAKILEELKDEGVSPAKLARLSAINSTLGDDLTELTLQLSFQDLTGQRIKKVVSSIHKIEETV
ncbi:MAG: chemotaxis protein CheZ, partial [Desulfovibrio sp.]|nr:chemotaxis protein CheZ [Desulfovibrio sp.]